LHFGDRETDKLTDKQMTGSSRAAA